jgi:hypothetical protein
MLMTILFGSVIALVALSMGWVLISRNLDIKEKSVRLTDQQKRTAPIAALKISACERLTIMLERSTPTSVVMRLPVAGMTATQLQLEVIKSIRQEFEHNVGLQIYVSADTWQCVIQAREETIAIIKLAFQDLTSETSSIELSQRIFLLEAKTENAAIQKAIEKIKEEINQQFTM